MNSSVPVVRQLAEWFGRNGYVRRQNAKRVANEGWMRYKKGDEIRLIATSEDELRSMRSALYAAGFKPGKPFLQGCHYRQPLYGRRQVAAFLEIVEHLKGKSVQPLKLDEKANSIKSLKQPILLTHCSDSALRA